VASALALVTIIPKLGIGRVLIITDTKAGDLILKHLTTQSSSDVFIIRFPSVEFCRKSATFSKGEVYRSGNFVLIVKMINVNGDVHK
jgi:hypothetical protein